MAVYLLTNTVGVRATEVSASGILSGYDARDAISGPRSRMVRASSGSSSRTLHYLCPATEVTHCVVSRMDLFKNTLDASSVSLQHGAGNTTDSTTAVGSLELVGITGQDWVKTIAQTATKFRAQFTSSVTTREFMYGKVYFAKAFSFGEEPERGPQFGLRPGEDVRLVKPLYGYEEYPVQGEFGLRWSYVTRGKVKEFEALPLWAPLFIYDDAVALFEHKLEHVVLTQWQYVRTGKDAFELALRFARLAHYD